MADKDLRISVLLDHYGAMLTDKQREVIDLYYNDDLSLAEIAEQEGITRQGVRDNIKRGEAQLLEMEQKLHAARRFERLAALVSEADETLAAIEKDYADRRRVSSVRQVKDLRQKLAQFIDDYFTEE
ncbi:MAG TPA: YlxM family DNA-binding protein [Candidatus Faecivivens stercoravium]|uniref:UPF0122 protein IAB37_09125 n=1 Tax=Candidatus Faecivivens stercoravium TaxID=2840803 RepID=A0A9D1J5M6_9FIRM|nr:YlxM family DNA-binding protein [Candidatus Faecivivens stercoravium]